MALYLWCSFVEDWYWRNQFLHNYANTSIANIVLDITDRLKLNLPWRISLDQATKGLPNGLNGCPHLGLSLNYIQMVLQRFQAKQVQVASLVTIAGNGFVVLVWTLAIALLLEQSFGVYFKVCNLLEIQGFDSYKLKLTVDASLRSWQQITTIQCFLLSF